MSTDLKAEPQDGARHTPGDWILLPASPESETLFVYTAGTKAGHDSVNGLIALVYSNGSGTQAANARLIAAAPELLKQLKDAVSFCELLMKSINESAGSVVWKSSFELMEEYAAIAKAEGRA